MIQVFYSPYQLNARNQLNVHIDSQVREGALLKFVWPNNFVGYADLLPWPELGDESLSQQLESFAQGRISPLFEQSMWCAKRDAKARKEKVSSFAGLPKVKNHYLVLDFTKMSAADIQSVKQSGFSTLKVKMGKDLRSEMEWVAKAITQFGMVMRLDFNSSLDFQTFERAMSLLKISERSRIEFIEDPFPYDENAWSEAAKLAPLAIDFEQTKIDWGQEKRKWPFKFVILKPARLDVQKISEIATLHDLHIVVTSSLDHPVGVAHAFWVAGEVKQKYPYRVSDAGCMSLNAYDVNEFSSGFIFQGPYLHKGSGFGIGFDRIWDSLQWKQIR